VVRENDAAIMLAALARFDRLIPVPVALHNRIRYKIWIKSDRIEAKVDLEGMTDEELEARIHELADQLGFAKRADS
jgi:hypothetical protein